MSIKTKLILAFLVVAALVPALGVITLKQIGDINADMRALTEDAMPAVVTVSHLDQVQRDQQAAVLTFGTTGRADDRQRYLDLDKEFDETFARWEKQEGRVRPAESQWIAEERTKFKGAATQILGSRQTVDRTLAELRAKDDEMVKELTAIRLRYVPQPGVNATEGYVVPQSLRYQISDLLLGAEGMLRVVDLEFALATGYVLAPSEETKARFETVSSTFNNWFQIASSAAGPDDRAILTRVQTRFFKEFEPAARNMMLAADFAQKARGTFTESSLATSAALEEIVRTETSGMTETGARAESALSSARTWVIVLSIAAFAIAGMMGAFFAGTITRPLVHLRDAAERVSRGEVEGVEIDITTKDEVGDLAGAFRRMVTSIRFLMLPGEDEPGNAALAGD